MFSPFPLNFLPIKWLSRNGTTLKIKIKIKIYYQSPIKPEHFIQCEREFYRFVHHSVEYRCVRVCMSELRRAGQDQR